MGALEMEKKIISVSNKRQITLPIKYYEEMGIGSEVQCYMQGRKIIIEPLASEQGYFSENILADLIRQGYNGQELLIKFKETNKKMKGAVEGFVEEAVELSKDGKLSSMKDVFGDE